MTRPPNLQRVRLEAGPSARFRFAVVADTHSKPHPATRERLNELQPDVILHAGDIGELTVLDELAKVAPVFAVRGNIDAHAPGVHDHLLVELYRADTLALRILLTHIAVHHGIKLRTEVANLARTERATLVVCGHSHIPFIGKDRGIGVFNPGSAGPKRFQLPIVFGVLDVHAEGASLRHIECATGAAWYPKAG